MEIILVNSKLTLSYTEPCCVCLGMFDGVHRGHQALLEKTVETARQIGIRSAAVTFLAQEEKDHIDTLDIQFSRFAQYVDTVFVFLFDQQLRNQSPEQFVADYLIGALGAKHIVCGFNFQFGHRREGNVETLQSLSGKYGYGLSVVPPVMEGEHIISSTLIRSFLQEGNLREANRMLGRPFAFSGIVRQGNQLGRTMQFPTINVPIEDCVTELPNGVYVSRVELDGKQYDSITNIGTAPTFGKKQKISETFLLHFNQDAYNKAVKISLYHFLRPEQRFSGAEELVNTIKGDVEKCAQYY